MEQTLTSPLVGCFLCVRNMLVHPVTNGWQSRLFLIFSCIEHAAVSLQVQVFVEACLFSSLGFLSRSGIAEPYGNSLVACRGNTRPAPKGYNTVCTGQPVLYKVSSPPCLHGAVITCAFHSGHPRACGALSHCCFPLRFPGDPCPCIAFPCAYGHLHDFFG